MYNRRSTREKRGEAEGFYMRGEEGVNVPKGVGDARRVMETEANSTGIG